MRVILAVLATLFSVCAAQDPTTVSPFAACSGAPLITPEIRTAILNRHNGIREMIARGQAVAGAFTKGCRNMFQLTYDCGLQERAQELADTCRAAVADYPLRAGENVHFVNIGGTPSLEAGPAIEAAITAWGAQAAVFSVNVALTAAGGQPNELGTVGYFAQIANSRTNRVGCGYSKCTLEQTVVVCLYRAARSDDGVVYKGITANGCRPRDCQAVDPQATCNTANGLCFAGGAVTVPTTTTTTVATTTDPAFAACNEAPLITPELRTTILGRHNGIREMIARGQAVAGAFTKGCRDMFQLTYDCGLQERAQELADTCRAAAADYPLQRGENVHFVNVPGTAALAAAPAMEAAIAAWEAQAAAFTVNAPLTAAAGNPNRLVNVGYFAQIANARTDRVGCGYSKCTTEQTVVVCIYRRSRSDDGIVYKGITANGCRLRDCQATNATATCNGASGLCELP